jgi:hypothetical protein
LQNRENVPMKGHLIQECDVGYTPAGALR